ncbi:MAG: hypothetical protein EBU84_19225 [Actinobacteria bacterium]|nr:hypothetical protein [Actinomycetota bacterium]
MIDIIPKKELLRIIKQFIADKNRGIPLELFAELVSPERAIILVTHDLGVADTTDRKVSMRDGKIISDERKTAAF